MTILITGATGFLGSALVEYFRDRGHSVRGTSRNIAPGLVRVGELNGSTDWRVALEGVRTVIHCAGLAHTKAEAADFQRINVDGTLRLAREAIKAGVTRFVFISSIGVNGDRTTDKPFTADDTPRPVKPYAASKLRAEEGLRALAKETGLELVIIRPPLIFGPGGRGNVALLAKVVKLGLPTPFGLTRNRRDVVSLSVLCRFVERAALSPVEDTILLASDGRPLSTRELLDKVAADNGRRKPLHLPVPVWLLSAAMSLVGLKEQRSQLLGNLEVDSGRAGRAA